MFKYDYYQLDRFKKYFSRNIKLRRFDIPSTCCTFNIGSQVDLDDEKIIYNIIDYVSHRDLFGRNSNYPISEEEKTIRQEIFNEIDFMLGQLITLSRIVPINYLAYHEADKNDESQKCTPLGMALGCNMIYTVKKLLERPDLNINLGPAVEIIKNRKITHHSINYIHNYTDNNIISSILNHDDIDCTYSYIDDFFEQLPHSSQLTKSQKDTLNESLKKCINENRFTDIQTFNAKEYIKKLKN